MEWDDVDTCDTNCPKCGELTVTQPCGAIGCEDGYYDAYEYDDPLWFDPGEMVMCEECNGKGYHHWCPKCGYDLLEKAYLNDEPEGSNDEH